MNHTPHSHLTGIAAFVQAVESKSFTAAAARMGLSKSAVAKNVARLEGRLGVRLLERTTRSLGLTVEGHSYYQTCLRVLAELSGAESLLAARRQTASGVLRVAAPASFGPRWAVPLLVDVLRKYPELQLEASFTDRYVDLVEEGIDLAIRIGELDDSASLVARRIGFQQSLLCASPGYFAAHGKPQRAADLEHHVCIGESREGRVLSWKVRDEGGEIVHVQVTPRHLIHHGEGLLNAALGGVGLVYLPDWLVSEHVQAGRLEAVMSSPAIVDRPIHLVWPKVRDVIPKVRVVVDELVSHFQPAAPWA